MNNGVFDMHDESAQWVINREILETGAYGFSPILSLNGGQQSGNYMDSFDTPSNHQQYQQHNNPTGYYGTVREDENHHLPNSHFIRAMDPGRPDQSDYFIRERCHTWPSQQRPPANQETANDDSIQHEYSSPPLPSRGSSGLSLISESNESASATPTSSATGLQSGGWTETGASTGQHGCGASVDSGHMHPFSTSDTKITSPLPVTPSGSANKRALHPTPSYKSGHPSYVELITQAILSSPEKRMTLSEIYDWMVANVPSFKDQRHLHSSAGWKNSVRHNLSLHARFKRLKRNGMDKPSWWTVDLSEEAKRERLKRPRQPRPRANTTTGTSREIQAHRQQSQQHQQQQQHQHRQAHVRGQIRASLEFAQSYVLSQGDHASSGRGSMSFSGSVTPASSVGSGIYSLGAPQYGLLQQQRSPLMPPPPPPIDAWGHLVGMPGDGMDWAQYAGQPAMLARPGEYSLESAVANVAESANLHCLSQAISVTLRDPTVTNSDCVKSEIAAGSGPTVDPAAPNYFPSPNSRSVSNLVQALRQNTLDEKLGISPAMASHQMLHVQTNGGHSQEVQSPGQSPYSSPVASVLQSGHPLHLQGLNTTVSPHHQSAAPMSHQPQQTQRMPQVSPGSHHFMGTGGSRQEMSTGPPGMLPDDLAALDVGGFDCNVMDVLSYDMNCGSNSTAGYT